MFELLLRFSDNTSLPSTTVLYNSLPFSSRPVARYCVGVLVRLAIYDMSASKLMRPFHVKPLVRKSSFWSTSTFDWMEVLHSLAYPELTSRLYGLERLPDGRGCPATVPSE